MSRIFLSHSSADVLEAVALKKWLVNQNPPLDNEIFLDVDPRTGMPLGIRWRDALVQANTRCEAVICLLSRNWQGSNECQLEYLTAQNLGKRIIPARLSDTHAGIAGDWQWVDLFGDGPQESIEFEWNDAQQSVSFPAKGLRRLRDEIIGQGIGAETFVWPPPNDRRRAPYRGWEPLEEIDAAVFFGRDAQLVRGLDSLRGMRKRGQTLFVVLGPSGAGKSSFLRAGLMPRMRREDRSFVVMEIVRPERHAITGDHGLVESICRTAENLNVPGVTHAGVRQACLNDSASVGAFLAELQRVATERLVDLPEGAAPPILVLPIDQAEELFGIDKEAEPTRFAEAMRLLEMIGEHARTPVGERVPLIVAMTIRTDHHEALQTVEQLQGVESEVFADLRPMPAAEFKAVIEGPARRASEGGQPLFVEPELVLKLLQDCRLGADTLPLLSLTLARLYKQYGDDGDLRLSEYLDMGEMRRVVQTEVDSVFSPDKEARAKQLSVLHDAFIPRLATINPENDQPVRRPARWTDLPSGAKPLLDQLIDKRLLTIGATGDTVEVALESLLEHWGELRGWLEDEKDSLKQIEVLKRDFSDWDKHGRTDDYLLEGQRVTDAEALLNSRFSENVLDTTEFVEKSRKRESKRRRRSQTLRAVLAASVIAVLVAGLAGWGLWNSQKTKKGMQLVTQSEQMLDGGLAGGDVRAFQQLLAARSLGAINADAVANRRRDLVRIMENPFGQEGTSVPVRAIAVSPDGGSRIAAANDDQTVRIWNAENASLLHTLTVDGGLVLSVAYSPDGKWIATGDEAGQLQLWEAETGAREGEAIVQGGAVASIAFSADGQLIATGGGDGHLRVWDTVKSTWSMDRRLVVNDKGSVRAVAFRPALALTDSNIRAADGSADILVSGNDDGSVQLWHGRTGTPIGVPQRLGETRGPTSVAFRVSVTEAGELPRVAVGSMDGTIQIFDGQTLQPLSAVIPAHPGSVSSVAFSTGGSRIVTGGTDNTVRVWDAGSDRKINLTAIGGPLIGHHGVVSSVAFNLDTTRIVSGGVDGSVRVWDAVTGLPIPAQQGPEVRAVAFRPGSTDPGEAQMASGGFDGTVKLWNPLSASQIGQLGVPGALAINSLAYSPDGTRIVTGGENGLQLWDLTRLAGLRLDATRPEHTALPGVRVKSVAFSPDSSMIVSGDRDGWVRVWDGRTLTLRSEHKVPYQVWSAAFVESGRVVSGSGLDDNWTARNVVQQWTVDPLQPVGEPLEGPANVYALAYHGQSDVLAAGGNDGVIRIWKMASGEPAVAALSSDQNTVSSFAFANGRPWIVSGGGDGKVRLWDVERGRPIGTPIDAQQSWVFGVAVSPDDKLMASAGGDGTIHLWPAPQDNLTDVICPKIGANMSNAQWDEDVSRFIPYSKECSNLPVPE